MRKKLLVILAVMATAFATAIPAIGAADDTPDLASADHSVEKGEYNSYIVVMQADPLVITEGQDALDTKKARARGNSMKASHSNALKDAGIASTEIVNSYVNALNGFSATLTHKEAEKVATQDGVAFVIPDELLQATTNDSPTFLGLDAAAGPWATGMDGEGVIVGVIDSGIWPEHPSFADDGTFPSAPTLEDSRPNCEFGNTAHNSGDAAFECNDKLIGARQMIDTYRLLIGADSDEYDSARDDNGHGTHTASTAAGNSDVDASIFGHDLGTVSGIAPRAHIIAYKGLGNLGGFTSDLVSAIDQAVADGVDVINYSIGGGAATPGGDEIAFLFADDAGVFVATSAGNSGPGAATLGNPGTMPWMTTVGASTQTRFYQGTIVLGNNDEYFGASITEELGSTPLVDGADHGNPLCAPGSGFTGDISNKIVVCLRDGPIGRAARGKAVLDAGGAGMILYNTTDDNNLFTDSHWLPAVHVDYSDGIAIKDYIADVGGSATAAITDTATVTEWQSAASMTYFSSRGPNPISPDIIKPDITAPGIQIVAGNSPTPIGGVQGELFQAIAGTSMSSPHVAGLFALLKQAHPDWSPATARSALMTTAYQEVVDNDRVSPADPFDFGAGHADPGNAVHKGSAFQPGLAYDAGLFEYAAYTCGEDFGVFTSGSCDFLESIGVPSDPSDLNYPSIGVAELAGSQTIIRTVTSVASDSGLRTYTANVDAPAGFDVTVSPSSFQIKKGQTATYEVTITNVSAPAGEWRFGSLTWSDKTDGYEVYSPIAVKAALFDAPGEVLGSGEAGAASFDVSFGYTGSYTATAHGMAADAPTDDNIGQDPDQTYPSSDDTPVGVQRIDFPVSGAAFARWELIIPGPDDIDLFLEDSSGTIIAASTNGGTDELIELTLPADDTYTMVVHGWSVPNAPLPYTLHYWEVPLASGGSLGITSAPASATIGASETVEVSWAGLSTGTRYLGAVSHTGDAGLMGLTLVNVDS